MKTITELEALASAAGPEWFSADQLYAMGFMNQDAEFSAAAKPETVIKLCALLREMGKSLDYIVRRLQMDIDDGSRPDQWSMEDLVRTAKAALDTTQAEAILRERDAKVLEEAAKFFSGEPTNRWIIVALMRMAADRRNAK
jgi:hypothetical protein